MPIESYPDQLEPESADAEIWRFLNMRKFRDLMMTSELYFCRADLLSDKREGLPPVEYLASFGLDPLNLDDRSELLNQIGSDAQFREGFYASCWHLFSEETCQMWKEYGDEGVAIISRYHLLRCALDRMSDRAFIGQIGYGVWNMLGKPANLFRYMTTKRNEYEHEREIRAFLWAPDTHAGINRHYGENGRVHSLPLTPPPERVPRGLRRRVVIEELVNEIVVSPYASSVVLDEVMELLSDTGHKLSVRRSGLAPFANLLP